MHTDDINDLVLMGLARDAAEAEAKALRRDYSLMQIDRNNLRSLLDATEAKVDELHDKLDDAQSEAKALRARVQELEAALMQIGADISFSPLTMGGVKHIARAALKATTAPHTATHSAKSDPGKG